MNPFLSPHIFFKGGFVWKNNPTTVSAVPNEVFLEPKKSLLDDSCCGSPQPRGQDATERDRGPGDLFFWCGDLKKRKKGLNIGDITYTLRMYIYRKCIYTHVYTHIIDSILLRYIHIASCWYPFFGKGLEGWKAFHIQFPTFAWKQLTKRVNISILMTKTSWHVVHFSCSEYVHNPVQNSNTIKSLAISNFGQMLVHIFFGNMKLDINVFFLKSSPCSGTHIVWHANLCRFHWSAPLFFVQKLMKLVR